MPDSLSRVFEACGVVARPVSLGVGTGSLGGTNLDNHIPGSVRRPPTPGFNVPRASAPRLNHHGPTPLSGEKGIRAEPGQFARAVFFQAVVIPPRAGITPDWKRGWICSVSRRVCGLGLISLDIFLPEKNQPTSFGFLVSFPGRAAHFFLLVDSISLVNGRASS